MCFFSGGYGRHREMEEFFARAVTGGRGVNGLSTLLVEIESVVNSRPLTYVEDDQDRLSYTLSPSHLINGRRVTNTSNDSHFEVISTNESLTRRARHHRHLLRQFTGQCRKTYLLSLRERHAQVTKN